MATEFMLDLETTDTIIETSDILQIAILELRRNDGGYWIPGRHYNTFLRTEQEPKTQFAKETMSALFEKCRAIPHRPAEDIRQEIIAFFKRCGVATPYVYLAGWNLTMLDIPMLVHKKILVPFYRQNVDGKDVAYGDFHYRIDEMSGRISQMVDVLNAKDRSELIDRAEWNCPIPIALPEGGPHDALWDCYNQTRKLNGLIRLGRR